jgi:hypothetical protein
MGTIERKVRIKPVQPTVIKDKKIVREVIEQIRRPIPPEVERRNKEIENTIMKMIRRKPASKAIAKIK